MRSQSTYRSVRRNVTRAAAKLTKQAFRDIWQAMQAELYPSAKALYAPYRWNLSGGALALSQRHNLPLRGKRVAMVRRGLEPGSIWFV